MMTSRKGGRGLVGGGHEVGRLGGFRGWFFKVNRVNNGRGRVVLVVGRLGKKKKMPTLDADAKFAVFVVARF